MKRRHSIPILLLSGFLGVGKTTLLNHLLENNQGLKIGVVINDFGKINIDSMLVSAQTDSTLELSNGCICCSLEDGNLDNALGQLAHQGSRLDYIIIEASGLAEVRELATMLRLIKNNYCHFDSLINLVDAANFKQNNLNYENALGDLEIADLIVINKVDLVSEHALEEIKKGIRLVAPKARLLATSHGQVDFRLLGDIPEKQSAQLKLSNDDKHQHDHTHAHQQFQSVSFQTDQPLDPQKFEAWSRDISKNVFRIKGIIFFGMKGVGQKFIFQAVGQRSSLKVAEWDFAQKPSTNLIVIGQKLNQSQIKQELNNLIDQNPDNISAKTLMDIFQYK